MKHVIAESVSIGRWMWAFTLTVFACIPIGLSLWAFLDAAKRPQWAWALSRHRQVVWMAGILFGVLTVILGLVISLWYLLKVRPVIAAVEDGDFDLGPGPTGMSGPGG